MTIITLEQHLTQLTMAVEALETPDNHHEVHEIIREIQTAVLALGKHNNTKVKIAVITMLDRLSPRINGLTKTSTLRSVPSDEPPPETESAPEGYPGDYFEPRSKGRPVGDMASWDPGNDENS